MTYGFISDMTSATTSVTEVCKEKNNPYSTKGMHSISGADYRKMVKKNPLMNQSYISPELLNILRMFFMSSSTLTIYRLCVGI